MITKHVKARPLSVASLDARANPPTTSHRDREWVEQSLLPQAGEAFLAQRLAGRLLPVDERTLMPNPAPPRGAFPAVAETTPMGLRCPRRSVVVFASSAPTSDQPARALDQSLVELGVHTKYLGREEDASRIAEAVVEEEADAVELCLPTSAAGVLLLRELLRQLIELGRRDVSIVVRRT